jgi:hypothetical protein
MSSTKTILQEINSIKKQIELVKIQKTVLKESLISEGLIDALVDIILGPFIAFDAIQMRKNPEYQQAMAKIKELDKLQKKLQAKSDKLAKEAEKANNIYNKKHSNIKAYNKTKAL